MRRVSASFGLSSVLVRIPGLVLLLGLCLGAQQAPAPRPAPASCPAPAFHPLTLHQRILDYKTALFSWERLGISAVSAGYGQWRDSPGDWPQGTRGYAERLGDSLARHAIGETVNFAVASALRDDQRYRPLHSGSMVARTLWALRWTALTHTERGQAVPNLPLFAGAYSAAFIANAWYPAAVSHPQNAMRRGSYALIGTFAFNLWHEFAPSALAGHRWRRLGDAPIPRAGALPRRLAKHDRSDQRAGVPTSFACGAGERPASSARSHR